MKQRQKRKSTQRQVAWHSIINAPRVGWITLQQALRLTTLARWLEQRDSRHGKPSFTTYFAKKKIFKFYATHVEAWKYPHDGMENDFGEERTTSSTKRAIVRAAAEIGKEPT